MEASPRTTSSPSWTQPAVKWRNLPHHSSRNPPTFEIATQTDPPTSTLDTGTQIYPLLLDFITTTPDFAATAPIFAATSSKATVVDYKKVAGPSIVISSSAITNTPCMSTATNSISKAPESVPS